MARKVNPDHKFSGIAVHIFADCSCGWRSAPHAYKKGARSGAIAEWHQHREICEAPK
jgi:hypothetical protein